MIVGIDEVGRGCWAGPLVAAAVVLPAPLHGLRDSKKLTAIQRERLARIIRKHATAIGIGWIPAAEVDELGLTNAVGRAMRQALMQIDTPYDRIVLDGNYNFLPDLSADAIVKADDTVPEVSAASIIAKVARDNYMAHMSQLYPAYQFDRHVGYGTALHKELLRLHGICDLHRLSYRPVKMLASA